jgi:ElaB/YqjD/DUF883 family membrane-anchored ribosome-binding protein
MAETANVATARSPRPRTTKKNGATARRPRTARRPAKSVNELERIIASLEATISHLTSGGTIRSTIHGATDQVGRAVSKASTQMGDMVADRLTDVAGRVRSGANSVTGVARAGTGAMQRVGTEIERHPLMTVAVALGIGFLAGMARRQE